MYELKLTLELKSPVLFSSQSGDSTFTTTLSYIPGTSLLGLLATRYLKENPDKKDDFAKLFLDGAVIFQNLYPLHQEKIYYPAPRYILQNKEDPSSLKNLFESEQIEPVYKVPRGFADPYGKYIRLHEPQKEVFFHHERDYSKGISIESKIFNYEALSAGQLFSGSLKGEESDLILIKNLLDQDPNLRLGKSKTAQYGSCFLISSDISEFKPLELDPNSECILVLRSDTIIKNSAGQNSLNIADLEAILGVEIEESAIEQSGVETVVNAFKTKRPWDLAFAAGSSFSLKSVPADYLNMLKYGLGERCYEGFGSVWFVQDSPIDFKLDEGKGSGAPSNKLENIPQVISEIAALCYRKNLEAFLASLALSFSESLRKNTLSKSLVGRLEAFAASGEFEANLQRLSRKPTNRLNEIYVGNKSLYSYLENIVAQLDSKIKEFDNLFAGQNKKFSELMTETKAPKPNIDELKAFYLKNLFLYIRKSKKEKREEDNE